MADLLDIASSTACEAVWINGQRLVVRGLSWNAAALIISRFPDVGDLFRGGINQSGRLIEEAGAAVGPIIAAGCGCLGDEKYEQAAANMVMDDQTALFEAIWRLTFPKGVGPFMERLARLRAGTGERAKPIKMRSRRSPLPSPDSSAEASRPTLQ